MAARRSTGLVCGASGGTSSRRGEWGFDVADIADIAGVAGVAGVAGAAASAARFVGVGVARSFRSSSIPISSSNVALNSLDTS